jgi:hypothetical protein
MKVNESSNNTALVSIENYDDSGRYYLMRATKRVQITEVVIFEINTENGMGHVAMGTWTACTNDKK